MRTADFTDPVSDILRLIWARVGNVRQQARPSANVAVLTRMRDAALQVAREALALADRLSVLIEACTDTRCERCGKAIEAKATGRPPRWCGEVCGRAAGRARIPVVTVSRGTDMITG